MDRRAFLSASAAIAVGPGRPALAARAGNAIGFCLSQGSQPALIDRIDPAVAAGFDYLEIPSAQLAALPDADYAAFAARLRERGARTPVGNLLMPNTMRITGPDIDAAAQEAHVARALARLQPLGARIVVWGSLAGRKPPPGFSPQRAFDQCADFCRRMAPLAGAHGMIMAIEPISRSPEEIRNGAPRFLSTAAQVLDLVQAVDDRRVQMIVDFYHLAAEREDPAVILKAGRRIRHLHVADPATRGLPVALTDPAYPAFFANLARIGYRGGLSIEAGSPALAAEAPLAIAALRQGFAGR